MVRRRRRRKADSTLPPCARPTRVRTPPHPKSRVEGLKNGGEGGLTAVTPIIAAQTHSRVGSGPRGVLTTPPTPTPGVFNNFFPAWGAGRSWKHSGLTHWGPGDAVGPGGEVTG